MRYIMITLLCLILFLQLLVNQKQKEEIENYKQKILLLQLKFDHFQKLKTPSMYQLRKELQKEIIPDTLSYEELKLLTTDLDY